MVNPIVNIILNTNAITTKLNSRIIMVPEKNSDSQYELSNYNREILILLVKRGLNKNTMYHLEDLEGRAAENFDLYIPDNKDHAWNYSKKLSKEDAGADPNEPININGGYTYGGCHNSNEITIYRQEEWFKVLIHELFHNLDLDFSTLNIDRWREKMFDIFGIESEYNIYETYCETWARILNIAIVSFMKSTNSENINKTS